MYFLAFLFISFGLQGPVSVLKDNGETIVLENVEFHQTKSTSSNTIIQYFKSGEQKSIEISKLKRINIKELVSRSKGVQKWSVILVDRSNAKYDVVINLVEVVGQNSKGSDVVIPAGSINKISL